MPKLPSTLVSRLSALVVAAAALGCTAETSTTPAAQAVAGSTMDLSDRSWSFAQIGDHPYTQGKIDSLPAFVSFINSDPSVRMVVHTGDIKAGSKKACTDSLFALVKSGYDGIRTPFVYTPGDNEWVDCHVAIKANGLYTPTERLDAIRKLFFPVAGQSLGMQKITTHSQAQTGYAPYAQYVENVWFQQAGVTFGTINIQGSNDDLAPWGTPLPANASQWPSQAEEHARRVKANLNWIKAIFDVGSSSNGIVLVYQADMWDPAEPTLAGFDVYVSLIGQLAGQYGKPVLLLHGDSHVFRSDKPFTANSPFFALHPNTPIAPNVTRIVNSGSGNVSDYVRITIDRSGNNPNVFSWQEVQFK